MKYQCFSIRANDKFYINKFIVKMMKCWRHLVYNLVRYSQLHTLMILTENKSALASTLEFGTNV